MNTIEMLKELVENGGMFQPDILPDYYFTVSDGNVCAVSKLSGRGFTMELNKGYLNATWKPYVKPVDWSKVPIDTKVLCRETGRPWHRRYFHSYDAEKDIFRTWVDGCNSWSGYNDIDNTETWEELKLADDTE